MDALGEALLLARAYARYRADEDYYNAGVCRRAIESLVGYWEAPGGVNAYFTVPYSIRRAMYERPKDYPEE